MIPVRSRKRIQGFRRPDLECTSGLIEASVRSPGGGKRDMFAIAIVGAGGMASMHARSYAGLSNARIAGVMDQRDSAARDLAAAHGAAAYTDFAEMLEQVRPD